VAATTLASHDSAPISTLIRLTNQPSDNFYAEMLTKVHGAIKLSLGTTASGLKAAASALARLGVRPTRVDGSGLSRGNRTSARTVERLLAALAANKAFVDSLAVAGKSGTLASRMGGTPAAGRCRGKTGTLSNVIGLAGFCTTQQGRTIAFAMLMNSLDSVSAARHSQDQIVKALATWRPAAPSAKLQ
jgi:D-alanyl-D-alanine carboxypeptidase/D-alanyl-D-alanine-endopeptidase (penicillin-binding protein 4)